MILAVLLQSQVYLIISNVWSNLLLVLHLRRNLDHLFADNGVALEHENAGAVDRVARSLYSEWRDHQSSRARPIQFSSYYLPSFYFCRQKHLPTYSTPPLVPMQYANTPTLPTDDYHQYPHYYHIHNRRTKLRHQGTQQAKSANSTATPMVVVLVMRQVKTRSDELHTAPIYVIYLQLYN